MNPRSTLQKIARSSADPVAARTDPENPEIVDVSAIMDEARFGSVQFTVLACTFLVLIMDGFDIQALAFTAPALLDAWSVSRASLGPVLASALMGMAVGAAAIGSFGDRNGRKAALVASCALMSVGSLASAFASGPMDLAVYRFITGIGLGGAMPNATALMFEFSPKTWRHISTSAALTGVPLGGMLGAAIARSLVPDLGWQALFVIGGAIPALLAVTMWLTLPESPRYLSTAANRGVELAALLSRISGKRSYSPSCRFSSSAAPSRSPGVAALFTREHRRDTTTLWVIFFTSVFSIYFFFNWLPVVLASAQLDFKVAVSGSLVFNLGGVVGTLVSSMLMDRLGSRRVIVTLAAAAIGSVACIAINDSLDPGGTAKSVTALLWTMASAGACMNALQIGMFSVAANAYPTACRSTGVGWSLAVARLGGIASSFVGAGFFALGMIARDFFLLIAGMLFLTFVSVIRLRRHIPPARTGAHQ